MIVRRMWGVVLSLVLMGCVASSPLQMTGLSGDPSPFVVSVNIHFRQNGSANPARGSLIVYPTNIKDRETFSCQTMRDQKEYRLSISRMGPADQANSFFFSFVVRESPYQGETYTQWSGYLPDPKRWYAFTQLVQHDFLNQGVLSVVITNHIFDNGETQMMTLKHHNERVKTSTVHFGCYTDDR